MGITLKEAIQILAENFSPFIHLPANSLAELDRPMRLFELSTGEEIRISARSPEGYLYLIDGEISVASGDVKRRYSASDERRLPITLAPAPDRLIVVADAPAILCQCESQDLDQLMSWQELAVEDGLFANPDALDRFRQVQRTCLAMKQLPLDCVEAAMQRMKLIKVLEGDEVVVQGEPGDALYILVTGDAEVWSQGLYDDAPVLVNKLHAGASFGEEALILGGTRTATVKMTTDGELLRLEKEDFDELIASSQAELVSAAVAKTMLDEGYRLLDVRYQEEYEDEHLEDSLLIPLPELRQRMSEIDPGERYLVLCKGGKRAEVATMLLKQQRIKAATIEGGIRDWPFEKVGGI
ncbi:cyclic nucleotide-binding domain-containing protein [Lamprobacter modestohalophilus]|uniref:cyclic nucleotide-binding domain-containing protein n=1 Tax=Lamprobacter modestohalophilus TaxID=1064514 RepID=UPI002ADEF288|nr:cyclic nucleotide-binding domain-containing protein [Lamprobacter modestohalophilus]MEA1051732.1 cyclic nucleotide-binding domain-containing protein [Lamprobacter modestohalophilus]